MQHPLILTKYIVLTDFGPGLGMSANDSLHTTFNDACNEWAEKMCEGSQSWVIEARLNAPVLDVTDEVRNTCIRWHVENHSDLPDWLIDVADDEGDAPAQRGYDIAKEAA